MAEDGKTGGGKLGNKDRPEAPPRSKSAKSRGSKGFKGPKSSSAALFEASGHGGKGGLSKRPAGSASIPKALNALADDDSEEEDVESSPVERKDSAPGGIGTSMTNDAAAAAPVAPFGKSDSNRPHQQNRVRDGQAGPAT